jgi:hypothetical protein
MKYRVLASVPYAPAGYFLIASYDGSWERWVNWLRPNEVPERYHPYLSAAHKDRATFTDLVKAKELALYLSILNAHITS